MILPLGWTEGKDSATSCSDHWNPSKKTDPLHGANEMQTIYSVW